MWILMTVQADYQIMRIGFVQSQLLLDAVMRPFIKGNW